MTSQLKAIGRMHYTVSNKRSDRVHRYQIDHETVGEVMGWGMVTAVNSSEVLGLYVGIQDPDSRRNGERVFRPIMFENPDDLKAIAQHLLELADGPMADKLRVRKFQEAVADG